MKCHNCGTEISAERLIGGRNFVASDCQPVQESLMLGACSSCGLMQKDTGAVWQACCDAIYKNYKIYHQGSGHEQKVKSAAGEDFTSRSNLLVGFLKKFIGERADGDAVDVGCGNGAFLKAFAQSFPQWNLYGSEINAGMKDEVEAISPKAHFILGDALFQSERRYDVLTLIHCIEHISNPADYLARLKGLLKPDGVLMIQVPDAQLNPFDLMIADHASHFAKDALTQILQDAGYKVLECGNVVLGKEITLVARGLKNGESEQDVKVADGIAFLQTNMGWLGRLEKLLEEKTQDGPIGIFGSSIGASWLASRYPEKVAFFVDQDENRAGREHMGRKIFRPDDVAAESSVLLALEVKLAHRIARNLVHLPVTWIVPPDL